MAIADPPRPSPLTTGRITNLDTVRGIATLGILVMNAVSYGLPDAAYFNLDAAGSDTWLDWTIGVAGEIFVDQKMMALFSLLFGVGIVVFADRTVAKGRRAWPLSLWRNLLLLVIGILHTLLWEGDILVVYAICAPLIIALRKRRPHTLLVLGSLLVLASAALALFAQSSVGAGGEGLGTYWFLTGTINDEVGLVLILDFFFRAVGMMLVGVALFRLDIVQGTRPAGYYRRMARLGLGLGLPLATAGVVWQLVADFDPDVAIASSVPNTVATIPIALGYLGVITLWNQRRETGAHGRIRAVGRMALTNYLTQTIIGVVVLQVVLESSELSRTGIGAFVLAVWLAQVAWSQSWLRRFRFGPFEWAWRVATYRRIQPLRR